MEILKINNYLLEKPLTSDNSGFSKWGIGTRAGEPYFIKEFLSPVYPIDDAMFTEQKKQNRINRCRKFVDDKKELYTEIRDANDGHIVVVEQFFRVGAKYYISTKAITDTRLTMDEIVQNSLDDKLRLCCSIAHAMHKLHEKKIVHCDIKPDNILIVNNKQLKPFIIDFDCSFFESRCPQLGEELNGDLVYLSPEGFLHIAGMESNLSCKMDVFALGLLFCQYLSGDLPGFDKNEYQYAYEAVLDDQPLNLDRIDNIYCRLLIERMLRKKPEDRLDMESVFGICNSILLSNLGREVPQLLEQTNSEQNNFFYTAGEL